MADQKISGREGSVDFFVRLGENDWAPDTATWRCPPLELPGSQVKELYVSGKRIDTEKYRIMKGQSLIRWLPTTKAPEAISVLVSVDTETSEKIQKDKKTAEEEKEKAELSEAKWRRFAIFVPIIVAIISGVFAYYLKDQSHSVSVYTTPSIITDKDALPVVKINGQLSQLPYQSKVVGDIPIEIDVTKTSSIIETEKSNTEGLQRLLAGAKEEIALNQRDFIDARQKILTECQTTISQHDTAANKSLEGVITKNQKLAQDILASLNNIDNLVSNSASSIVNSCSGGPHGITPDNGGHTIQMLNEAKVTVAHLRDSALQLTIK